MKKTIKQLDISELEERGRRLEALINLSDNIREKDRGLPLPFNDFLFQATLRPQHIFRDIFQYFHDMVDYYVPDSEKDMQDNVGFAGYDINNLFIKECDSPFFADRLFAHRFMNMAKSFRKGVENNRIYLFEGPPGSGKSTFLNNLLYKMEQYSKIPEGAMYKTRWSIDIERLGGFRKFQNKVQEQAEKTGNDILFKQFTQQEYFQRQRSNRYLEFSCPNQDHPILQIPISYRKKFLEELIPDEEFKEKLFGEKQYEWVLKDIPCSICKSLFTLLLEALEEPLEIYNMLHARVVRFSRQFGEGISIFSPGDVPHNEPIRNINLQNAINDLFNNDDIKYVYSYLAKTNNGVFALMDIKEHNVQRLMNLHGIISDGVHKVDLVEEQIKSLFMGLVNPEDKKHYENVKSFQDRIITVYVPYILDFNTEVAIYKNKYNENISRFFLPRVLDNFAKIVIATRLDTDSPALMSWLENPYRYTKFIDRNLLLLKMDVYAGKLPSYLSEEDVKRFDAEARRKVINASETEGKKGFSGRKSLNIFNDFFSKYSKSDKLISMEAVKEFFQPKNKEMEKEIPLGFIESLMDLYDFNVLQEVKEAIYFYNEKQISRDIQNYLFAINYEIGDTKKCPYTGDNVEITGDYFKNFEAIFLGTTSTAGQRLNFRKDNLQEYITRTLSQEIQLKQLHLTETELFKSLFEKYTHNLKENSLAPYADNQNFRRAISDFNKPTFNTYDDRMKRDINLLLNNLQSKFKYTLEGAQQITLYVLDKKIVKKY